MSRAGLLTRLYEKRLLTMRFSRTAFVVIGFLLLTSLGFAQSTLGSITVFVTDQQGAVVPGAKVTLSDVDTNVKHTDVTSAEGSYVFAGVAPGSYVVTVLATGFREVRSSVLTQTAS